MTDIRLTTFGCDPEIFVKNKEGDVCSAIGLFGGTKEKPRPIKSLGEGFAVQEDNVLVEFNIPPAKSGKEFAESVQKTVDVLTRRALRHGLSFTQGSAFSLKPEYLQDPKALVFGCEPDYNAYTTQANPAPKSPDACLRSAGGHVAFGVELNADRGKWWKETLQYQRTAPTWGCIVIKKLDYLLGIPSILLDDGELRKQLYGKAGAFRAKPFGVEYRTLSNFWIFNPKLAEAMIEHVKTVNFYTMGMELTENCVEMAINTNNKECAAWTIEKDRKNFGWVKEFL